MASEKTKVANQANAKLSSGSSSAAGKARSSQNSRAHGILSAGLLLKDEDPEPPHSNIIADRKRARN